MNPMYILLLGIFIAPGPLLRLLWVTVDLMVGLFHAAKVLVLLVILAYQRWGAKRTTLIGLMFAMMGMGLFFGRTANAGTVSCVNYEPQFQETYQIPAPGQPGLVFVGAHNADKTVGFFLTSTGWVQYDGGLYPPYSRYDNGLPASVTIQSVLPNSDGSTSTEQGWSIYIGYGVLTPKGQDMVKTRREALNEIKPQRVAQGKWDPSYDSDDRFKWALVQKNMTENNLYQKSVAPIPLIFCAPEYNSSN